MVIKLHLKESYDKQNLTLAVISYGIYETRQKLVSYISYEMTTHVRSSILIISDLLCPFSLLRLHRKLTELINAFSKVRMFVFCGLAWWKKPEHPEETTYIGR